MGRMTDEEIQRVFDNYSRLRAHEGYWVAAGMALVEYLHITHGMKYAEIYEITDRGEMARHFRKRMSEPRLTSNVVTLPVVRIER